MNTPTNTNPALVLAWQVVRFDHEAQDNLCAFYAETTDGEIFTTGFRPYTREVRDNFNVKGDTWTKITERPAAEFIGRYDRTRSMR